MVSQFRQTTATATALYNKGISLHITYLPMQINENSASVDYNLSLVGICLKTSATATASKHSGLSFAKRIGISQLLWFTARKLFLDGICHKTSIIASAISFARKNWKRISATIVYNIKSSHVITEMREPNCGIHNGFRHRPKNCRCINKFCRLYVQSQSSLESISPDYRCANNCVNSFNAISYCERNISRNCSGHKPVYRIYGIHRIHNNYVGHKPVRYYFIIYSGRCAYVSIGML